MVVLKRNAAWLGLAFLLAVGVIGVSANQETLQPENELNLLETEAEMTAEAEAALMVEAEAELVAEAEAFAKWEAGEHRYIGDEAWDKYGSDYLQDPAWGSSHGGKFWAQPWDLRLSYGELIALGGDFFGRVPTSDSNFLSAPISSCGELYNSPECVKAFMTVWNSFKDKTGPQTGELGVLVKEIRDYEGGIVYKTAATASLKEYFSKGILKKEQDFERTRVDPNYARITANPTKPPLKPGSSTPSTPLPDNPVVDPEFPLSGRYMKLASNNLDHFRKDAEHAYAIAHNVALRKAIEASDEMLDPDTKFTLLTEAYGMNAFADHFLTDLFSAGHIRAQRRELVGLCNTAPLGTRWASLLAKCIHDEDNQFGLNYINKDGVTKWRGFGDKMGADDRNKKNRNAAIYAVGQSMKEISKAFTTGFLIERHQYGYLTRTPDLSRTSDTCGLNHAPLIRKNPETKKWERRSSMIWDKPTWASILSCPSSTRSCRATLAAETKTLVEKAGNTGLHLFTWKECKYKNPPASPKEPQPLQKDWTEPGPGFRKGRGFVEPPKKQQPPPKQGKPSNPLSEAWPCAVHGVTGGKCVPTSTCQQMGGVSYAGYCAGPPNVQCCHTDHKSVTKIDAGPHEAKVCWGNLGKGICESKGDCSHGKGKEGTAYDCKGASPICCRHQDWCPACDKPPFTGCRACWDKGY